MTPPRDDNEHPSLGMIQTDIRLIEQTQERMAGDLSQLAVFCRDVPMLRADVARLERRIDRFEDEYATKSEIKPLTMFVYGVIATITASFLSAIVYIIGWGPHK